MNQSSWVKMQLWKMAGSKSKLIVQAKPKCFLWALKFKTYKNGCFEGSGPSSRSSQCVPVKKSCRYLSPMAFPKKIQHIGHVYNDLVHQVTRQWLEKLFPVFQRTLHSWKCSSSSSSSSGSKNPIFFRKSVSC